LTTLFLFPLLKTTSVNPRTRRIARRALLAAFVALTTSTTNIAILAILKGRQLGWLCLGSCGTDVILNALVVFWVTARRTTPTSDTYVSGTPPSFKTEAGPPVRSILRQPDVVYATSGSGTHHPAGPHRITNAYYSIASRGSVQSPESSTSSTNPRHPFARATYSPRIREPEVHISATPDTSMRMESPSALRSLVSLFRKEPTEPPSSPEDIQITVSTQIDITSLASLSDHDIIYEDTEPESGLSDTHSIPESRQTV
jgi:hypothetical protein